MFVWWGMFFLSTSIVAVFVGFVLVRLVFRVGYYVSNPRDLGLANFKEQDGRTILFEPNFEYTKYICQYIISRRKGKKVFICKFNGKFDTVDMSLTVFDSKHNPQCVLNIKHNPLGKRFTDEIELPKQTAFVSLVLNSVDGHQLPKVEKKLPTNRLIVFGVTAFLAILAQLFFATFCLIMAVDETLVQTLMFSPFLTVLTVVIAVLITVAIVTISVTKLKKDEKNSQKVVAETPTENQ